MKFPPFFLLLPIFTILTQIKIILSVTIDCTNNINFQAYTRVIEDNLYNVSLNSVDYDTRGSLYGCGAEDNDPTGLYTTASQKGFIFKLLSNPTGTPTLDWMQIIEPAQYTDLASGLSFNDYQNYTTCVSISWLGNRSDFNNYSPAVGHVVFAGNSVKVYQNWNYNNTPGATGCQVCYIGSMVDNNINTAIIQRLQPDCYICTSTIADPNSIDGAFILAYSGVTVLLKYNSTLASNQIIQQRIIQSGVSIQPVEVIYSFDQSKLFFLGMTQSFKFSQGSSYQDCFVMSLDIFSMQGIISGTYFGTVNQDTCKAVATNRYDWQVVIARAKSSTLFTVLVCHIMMMNEYGSLIWSKEFG